MECTSEKSNETSNVKPKGHWQKALLKAVYYVVSIISGTGAVIRSTVYWPP
jgi:hypothetical protein